MTNHCKNLTKHLEARKILESHDTWDYTNIIDEEFGKEGDVFKIIVDENFANSWILDYGCSIHMCPYKECFGTYKECDASIVFMGNDSSSKVIEIGPIKVRMFDGVVKALSNVKHIPKLRRSLIYLKTLDNLDYDFSTKNGIMKINKGTLVAMNGKKVKILYTLIGKTILSEAMKVEPSHKESFASVKEIVEVNEHNKMIKTQFSIKSTHWHKNKSNCKMNEVMKKTKTVSRVKFDENLNLTHVYSH